MYLAMKRILLPTDFSDNALNAIRYALQVFQNDTCIFFLLHTYTPAVYQAEYVLDSPGQLGFGDIRQVRANEKLNAIRIQMEKEFANAKHTFIIHSAFNVFVGEVLETVKNENIDLIVMGTQGVTGAKEILFGTHAVHVIRKANCPVVAVPSKYVKHTAKHILFPTDFEVRLDKGRIRHLLDLAVANSATLHVLHIAAPKGLSQVQETNKGILMKVLHTIPNKKFHDHPDQEIIVAINNFQSKMGIDMLVMVQNKHTFFERLFIDPVIKKIGLYVQVPFMVIPCVD